MSEWVTLKEACASIRLSVAAYDARKCKPFKAFIPTGGKSRIVLKSQVEKYMRSCMGMGLPRPPATSKAAAIVDRILERIEARKHAARFRGGRGG